MGLPEPLPVEAVSRDGVAIRAWDYGGAGPVLMCCHCTGTCGRIWEPILRHFTGDYRFIAVDARGHGDSGKPTAREAYSWPLLGTDLLAVLDALGLDHVMAAGHSGGATQVVAAALQRPGAFTRVALLDAIVGPPAFFAGPSRMAAAARRRKNHFDSREDAFERFRTRPPLAQWDDAALRAYIDYAIEDDPGGGVRLKCPGELEAYYYELGGQDDGFDRLGTLEAPALLVTAERSDIRPLVALQRQALPGAGFVELPGYGHFFPLDAPGETAAVLEEWFAAGK